MDSKLPGYPPSGLSIRRWTPLNSKRSTTNILTESLSDSFMPSHAHINKYSKHHSRSRKLLKKKSQLPEIRSQINKASETQSKINEKNIFLIKKRIYKSKSLKVNQIKQGVKIRKILLSPVEWTLKKTKLNICINK